MGASMARRGRWGQPPDSRPPLSLLLRRPRHHPTTPTSVLCAQIDNEPDRTATYVMNASRF
jgi:hypothetical protein